MSSGVVTQSTVPRKRDPERRTKILSAAAKLFALRGYHAVSLGDIGAEAGIVGSGIYRHFDRKYSVLVALLEQAIGDLLGDAEVISARERASHETLRELVHQQVVFCLDRKLEVQLYRQEISALEEEDSRRLRRMQRRYNEEWIATLLELRPELDDATARTTVHSAIGAIQAVVTYDSGLPRDELIRGLDAMAQACLSASW